MLLINCYPQGKVKKNKTLLLCNIHHHHHPHQDVFSSVFRSTPSLFSPSPPRPSSSSSPLQSITRQKISNLCLETTPFLSDPGKLSHALSYMWFVCTGYYKCICQCFYRTQVRSLAMLVINSLTDWLATFSKLDWCDVWRCLLKTCWSCYCCWWESCWRQFVADLEAEVWS